MFEARRLGPGQSPESLSTASGTSIEPPGSVPAGPGGRSEASRASGLTALLWTLRAGPALMLAAIVVAASLSTPLFMTTGNIGNVLDAVGGHRRARDRPAAGDPHARHRPVGRARRWRLRRWSARSSSRTATAGRWSIGAMLATGLAVGAVNGVVFVYGRVPHPFIVTLATLSIARGLALLLSDGQPSSACPQSVVDIGGGRIGWFPHSAFVVAALAAVAVVLLARDGLGPLDLRGRRQPGGRAAHRHPACGRCWSPCTC